MNYIDVDGKTISIDGNISGYDWSNKNIVFMGDSLSAGGSGYPSYVCEELGAHCVNIAKSGFAIFPDWWSYRDRAQVTEEHLSTDYRRQVSKIPQDVDLVVMTGDINANAADGSYDNTGKSTWFGRWNDSIDAIHTSFPEVPVLLVAEYCLAKNSGTYSFAEALRQVSEYKGCAFLCLPWETGLNLKYSTVFGQSTTDHTHVSAKYMPMFADFVIEKIRKLKPYNFTGTDTLTLSESSVSVAVDSTVTVTATTTGDHSVRWTTSDASVACVMGGVIYGMTAGTATITATTRNSNVATVDVTVTD